MSHNRNPNEASRKWTQSDNRARTAAQMAVQGCTHKEIANALGVKSANNVIRQAGKKGYTEALMAVGDATAQEMRDRRARLADNCLGVMEETAERILDKMSEELSVEDVAAGKTPYFSIQETKLCKDMLEATEHTGKKIDAPVVEVNISHHETTLTQSIENVLSIADRNPQLKALLDAVQPAEGGNPVGEVVEVDPTDPFEVACDPAEGRGIGGSSEST